MSRMMKKLGYYLSIAYYDVTFRFFFCILTLKLFLFTYISSLYIRNLGIEGFLPSFGSLLISLSLSLLISTNILKFLFLLFVNFAYSLLFFVHSLYLKYFNDFASIYNLAQIHQLPSVSDAVISIINKESLFFIDVLFLPLILLLKQKHGHNATEKNKTLAILSLLGLYCNTLPFATYPHMSSQFLEKIYDRSAFVRNMGIIDYQIADIYYYLSTSLKKEATEGEIAIVKEWKKKRSNGLKNANNLSGKEKGMNLIIIQVESLQNFVINRKYNGLEITPNLNKLAKGGLYFNNIYDQTADGNSSDSTLLANASLYPARKGAASFLYPNNCFDSLPRALREHGYTTAVMHGYFRSYWNSAAFEKALGFEHQFYNDDYILTEKIGWGLSDKAFFSQSLEKIKGSPVPFYVFMRTLSTHGPFDYITEDIDDFPLRGLEGDLIGNYIRSMHYVDSAIGGFLSMLSESNLFSNTVIVVYGDHRARLLYSELKKIGISDEDENRKIPLVIRLPDGKHSGKRDTVGGLVDIAPTVCNILGIDKSDKFFMGKDLGDNDSFVIFRDGSYIGGNGGMNKVSAQNQLKISDLILEKDIIPIIRNEEGCK